MLLEIVTHYGAQNKAEAQKKEYDREQARTNHQQRSHRQQTNRKPSVSKHEQGVQDMHHWEKKWAVFDTKEGEIVVLDVPFPSQQAVSAAAVDKTHYKKLVFSLLVLFHCALNGPLFEGTQIPSRQMAPTIQA